MKKGNNSTCTNILFFSAISNENFNDVVVITPSSYHQRCDSKRSFVIYVNQIVFQNIFNSLRIAS